LIEGHPVRVNISKLPGFPSPAENTEIQLNFFCYKFFKKARTSLM
jgi:hypothetical protein